MGTVDIYHSRRTYYAECKYWICEEKDIVSDATQWILKHVASGTFFAKEVSPQYNQFNPINNRFAFDKNTITLECDDDLSQITRGCVVLYNGKAWTVDDVQKSIHRKESEFNVEIDYKYTIALRR